MNAPDPVPGISFLDLSADPSVDELDPDDAVSRRAARRHATVQQWWPQGSGAGIAGLFLVLVAWLGTAPLGVAVAGLFDVKSRDFGDPSFGGYYGIRPELLPIISFGVRAVVAVVALGFGLRARRSERSPLATACVAIALVSLALFVAGGVIGVIAVQLDHVPGYGSVF